MDANAEQAEPKEIPGVMSYEQLKALFLASWDLLTEAQRDQVFDQHLAPAQAAQAQE